MSSGRPDYNQKVVPIPEMIGDDETAWSHFKTDSVAAGATVEFYTYTVPAGYDLYLTMIIFSCEQPGTVAGDLEVNDTEVYATYFDTQIISNLASVGYIKVSAGEKLDVNLFNGLPDDSMFAITLRGYLKET